MPGWLKMTGRRRQGKEKRVDGEPRFISYTESAEGMPANKRFVPLLESERAPVPGARRSGRLDPNERILVTVILRPRSSNKERSAAEELGMRMPLERTYPTREEFAAKYGATRGRPGEGGGLRPGEHARRGRGEPGEALRRPLWHRGTVRSCLQRAAEPLQAPSERCLPCPHRSDLPAQRARPLVQAVLGLDNRPQAQSAHPDPQEEGRGGRRPIHPRRSPSSTIFRRVWMGRVSPWLS